VRPIAQVNENVIYFLPNSEAKQSTIYFFIEGDENDKSSDVARNAFNQYFSGGFNGLVMQEIREYRSMAYTVTGGVTVAPVPAKKARFFGYIGTQADKTIAAIEVFMDLLNNMPEYPERMDNIRNYMVQTAYLARPEFRYASQTYAAWRLRGYTQSPSQENMAAIESLTFDDIVKYYEQHIKGRKVAIGIVGNPKQVDKKQLAKFGRVEQISASKVFSKK